MVPSSTSRATASSQSRYESPSRNSIQDSSLSTSTIRPRNKRLVSTEQELVSTSATNTPSGSRTASPLPSRHPSRSVSKAGNADGNRHKPVGGLLAPPGEGTGGGGSPIINGGGIWESGWMSSWSTLQGLANTVLGGTEAESGRQQSVSGLRARPGRARGSSATGPSLPGTWGPDAHQSKRDDNGIGTGSTTDRENALLAKKRVRVLEGRDDESKAPDTNGNYKRRTSVEEQRPKSSQDTDYALVYVHHVQKQDTLQGVVLKYNCRPEVFRKANRFWPNDSIQTRNTVVLPVEACAIKGRPCDPPSTDTSYQGADLLAPTPGSEDPSCLNGGSWPGAGQETETLTDDVTNPWEHVRWVLVESSPNSQPVEIARMPRKTLGYFPPRRRKSVNTISTASTPRDSSDFSGLSQSLLRHSGDATVSAASPTSRRVSSFGSTPQIIAPVEDYFPPIATSARQSRESFNEAANKPRWMRGPGGVGTMGKNVRKPGPGKDGLNSWAKRHIPGLAIDSLPSTSVLGTSRAHFGFQEELSSIAEGPYNPEMASETLTARSGQVQGLGFELAAAAVEGWMRRLAIKAPGTPKNGGRMENPDLIELLDGTGSDDGRGFELSPGRTRSATPNGTGREDLDGVLRGRASAGAKGGKSD